MARCGGYDNEQWAGVHERQGLEKVQRVVSIGSMDIIGLASFAFTHPYTAPGN